MSGCWALRIGETTENASFGNAGATTPSRSFLIDALSCGALPSGAGTCATASDRSMVSTPARAKNSSTSNVPSQATRGLCGNQNLTARSCRIAASTSEKETTHAIDATPARWRGVVRSLPLNSTVQGHVVAEI